MIIVFYVFVYCYFLWMLFARNSPMTDFAPSSVSFWHVLVKFVPVMKMSPTRMMSVPLICSLLKRKSSAGLVLPVAMCLVISSGFGKMVL